VSVFLNIVDVEFGIKYSNLLASNNVASAILDACFSTDREVRESAFHVLCLLASTSEKNRKQIIDDDGLQILRNHVHREQLDVLFTLASLSRHGLISLIFSSSHHTISASCNQTNSYIFC
jgi:uncharacterized membrane protein